MGSNAPNRKAGIVPKHVAFIAGLSWLQLSILIAFPLLVSLAILLPPWLEPTDSGARYKLIRTKSELRSLATALESFDIDNGRYPGTIPLEIFSPRRTGLLVNSDWRPATTDPGTGKQHPGLTTPVAYWTSLDSDRYADTRGLPYAYYNDEKGGWIIFSPGPDGDYDINPPRDYDSTKPVPSASLIQATYDPSNGTDSNGDIYRLKD